MLIQRLATQIRARDFLDFARNDKLSCRHQPQPEPRVEFSAIMRATARQTRNRAANSARPRKIAAAVRTFVKKTPRAFCNGKGEIVAAFFIADAKIEASLAPFRSMRQNAAPAGPKLREKMRELMTKSAIDFGFSVFSKSWIQRNQFVAIIGAAGATFQTRVPFYTNEARNSRRISCAQ